jgi:hypothetical protein
MARLHEAAAAIQAKGTPEDLAAYQRFVLDLAQRVAAAHKEHGEPVSPSEQEAVDTIAATLGAQAAS